MNGLRLLAAALLLGSSASSLVAQEWTGLRDGALHLRPTHSDNLQVAWLPAWQADANAERLFLQAGDGRLLGLREIAARETRGRQEWPLAPADGDQRLEIPGYSFRHYRVSHADETAALFEPAKVHFSAELPSGVELYFRVGAGERAVLGGKFHGGVHSLQLERLGDGLSLELPLLAHRRYAEADHLELPVGDQEQVWRLRLAGSGKAAFWLDGSANLFAQRPEHLFRPDWAPGRVRLALHPEVLGPTPRLGVALPYTPPDSPELLARLAPRAASYYSFIDVMARRPQHEQAFRPLYLNRYGIDTDITLLSKSWRRPLLESDQTQADGLSAWVDGIRSLGGRGTHYLALADEPNLNFPDYGSFERYFSATLARLRQSPGAREAGVRIALPSSSRLLNGPSRDGARERRGMDWARRLLEAHGQWVDALSWHEWMVRDLRATRVYRENVRQAAQLVGLDARGQPRKALLIGQTNLSSGNAVSPYEQETRFAALWWTSVAINSAQDGLLTLLNWFPAFDNPDHAKGLVGRTADGGYRLKPVGQAMVFMQRHWLDEVLRLDNDAFEVDALAMRSGKRQVLLGVNKAERRQAVEIEGLALPCDGPSRPALVLYDEDERRDSELNCEDARWRFSLPAETLFALTWETP
ncbi:hypothetical protein D9M69_184800 [compost metagenome]